MILAYSETDVDGFFYCYGVPVGNSYAVIVGADNYNPIIEDDAIQIAPDEYEDWYLGASIWKPFNGIANGLTANPE